MTRRIPTLLLCSAAALLWAAAFALPETTDVSAPHDPNHHSDDNDDATMHHRFENAAEWVARFDDPARAAWQKPDDVVRALGLASGGAVADIGAGTGYFNRFLSAAVGASGRVYAIDVEPSMVSHMKERAVTEKTPNVVAILAEPSNPEISAGGVDAILVCDTYHHIDNRLDYFQRLKKSVRPGGRLAIVDFKPGDLPVGPPAEHKLAPEFVIAELTKIGWRLAKQPDFLPYQYFLIFTAE